jgi:hypothetical protein
VTLDELGIARPCDDCKGKKMARRFSILTGEPMDVFCPTCNATGMLPTELGKELIKFLKQWMGQT